MYNEGMMIKRINENRIVVSSADNQFYVIIEKQGFRDWKIAFFHDSQERALSIKHCYSSGMAEVYAKKFIEENVK